MYPWPTLGFDSPSVHPTHHQVLTVDILLDERDKHVPTPRGASQLEGLRQVNWQFQNKAVEVCREGNPDYY